MARRVLPLTLLVALLGAAPAAGKERAARFPSLRSSAGASKRAQAVERRVRRIETSLLGGAHAAEHARGRSATRVVRRRRAAGTRQAPAALQPDNTLQPPSVGGFWAPGIKLPIVAIHATLMRTGRVLFFAYPWRPGRPDPDDPGQTLPDPGYADAYVFDPATGTSRKVTPPVDPDTGKPAYIFCAATSTLPDGRVLVVGGDVGNPTADQNQGLNAIYTFDPLTESWQTQPRMRQGRWYPSNLELPDGRTLILAGAPRMTDPDWPDRANSDVEVFSPNGTLQRYSSFRVDGFNGHPPLPGQYPHLFWLPGGRALVAGPRSSDTWTFTPPAAGVEASNANWADVADLPTPREWAAGALLPGTARAMLFGGAGKDDRYYGPPAVWPATATTTIFDDAAPQLGWRPGPDMHAARAFANSVLLPDGKVAVIGGGPGEDSNSEYYRWRYGDDDRRVDLFDPDANAFTFGNAQAEGRTYHSTALLLPDARVMSAGDDINGPTGPDSGVRTDTAEMWSPPYLFDGCASARRPSIASVPASVGYDSGFEVKTPDDISGAVLVAPAAVTHDNDMGQRVVPLAPPVRVAGGVRLRTPYDGNAAPPGPYMLFLRDLRGVPSVARFVMLGGTAPGVAPAIAVAPAPEACPDGPGPSPTATASPSPGPTATPTATPVTALRVRLAARAPRLRRLRSGRRPLSATLALTAAARVTVTVDLERRSGGRVRLTRIASPRRLRFARAGTRRLAIRLAKARRHALDRRRAVTLRITAVATPAWGRAASARRRLRVR